MTKKIAAVGILMLSVLSCFAKAGIVEEFGRNLQKWASTNDLYYCNYAIDNYCRQDSKMKTIVKDEIVKCYPRMKSLQILPYYDMTTYSTLLQLWINDKVEIRFSEIRAIPRSELSGDFSDKYDYVACRIRISGAVDMDVHDLFYIDKDDRIIKIETLAWEVDRKSGKRKVKINLDDIFEMSNYGVFSVTYNYSKHFPIGMSLGLSYQKFFCGLDFGVCLDKYEIKNKSYEITNIMNYTIKDGLYKPKFFVTLSPGFFMKYFSVSCGLGAVICTGTITETSRKAYTTDYGFTSSESSFDVSDTKYKFMVRPNVRGYIPCSELFSIVVSVGYDCVIGIKDLNGINFGAGFAVSFD